MRGYALECLFWIQMDLILEKPVARHECRGHKNAHWIYNHK